jgi:PilZ domain
MRLNCARMRERRKVPRYQLGKMAMLYPPGGGVGTKAVVYAISTQGCAVDCEKSPEVGKKCELYIETETAQIGVEAQAVSIDSQGRTGLKFLPVDNETQKRLSDLCATLRIQSLSAPVPEDVDTARPESPQALEPVWGAPLPSGETLAPHARGVGNERRQVPRYISELRASLSHPASGTTSSVALITLSILGGCLEGEGLPEPVQNCEVDSEWDGRPLRLPGQVVWKIKKRAGVKFDPLDEATEKLLRQVCANLRLQPLAPLPPEPE